ncbi:hypothetical protein [Rhodoblastus sp.]|uniref:hypothetical protein n=1 Tax=Rhodoblastus sp. TaxID=1962975 RepID=UPI00262D5B64|nr:hypothetical protein [Rhodoblastus sp.]
MTIYSLVTGVVHRAPREDTSKAGKPYVAGDLKLNEGLTPIFVRLVAFSEPQRAELLQLREGGAVSVSGRLDSKIFSPNHGEPRVSHTLFVESVLSLKKSSRPKVAPAATEPPKSAGPEERPPDFHDDALPF